MLYHSARGSVDYTIEGSPTIVDSVVSGFSGSDYVRIADAALDWNNNVEWVVKVETPATYASYNQIVYMAPMFLYVTSTGRLSLMYTSNGNVKYLNAVSSLQTSTTYYIKIVKDTTSFSLYLSSDGITYDLQQTRTDFLPTTTSYVSYGINGASAYTPWLGSIDLKETYIKVNGQPWFGICPVEVKKHQLMGPVGYTVSGSPSTENGVLKNVSRTNRVYTSLSLPNFETLEVLIKAKKETTWKGRVLCLCGFGTYNSQKRITTNDQSGENQGTRLFSTAAGIIVSIDNSRFDVTQYAPLGYYTRLRVTKNTEDYTYELGLSADKESWVTASANYEDNICTGQVYFLQNASGVYAADEMSLDETYIKVNGKLWYWQPRETEKIVVNGVEVWTKPQES